MKTIYVKDIFRKVPHMGGIKWKKCIPWKQVVPTFLFLGAMFLLGRSAGEIMGELPQRYRKAKTGGWASGRKDRNPQEMRPQQNSRSTMRIFVPREMKR